MLKLQRNVPSRSTAAQPNFFTVRSYGMPGGEVEYDTMFYREGDPYMDRFVAGELREEDEEHVRNIAEARLSVRDLLMQPSVEGWGGPDISNHQPSPAEAGITTGAPSTRLPNHFLHLFLI